MIRRIDWRKLINDLSRSGLSHSEIGTRVGGYHRTTVLQWREGTEPRHSAGMALVMLYESRLDAQAPIASTNVGSEETHSDVE